MAGVSLADARRVIAAAEKKAQEIGQPMNIAVADEGGNIVAHVRMDGAWIGSIDISMKKAYTSRAFDIATKDLAAHSQSGGQFFGIHVSNDCKIMIFAGGIPLKRVDRQCLSRSIDVCLSSRARVSVRGICFWRMGRKADSSLPKARCS